MPPCHVPEGVQWNYLRMTSLGIHTAKSPIACFALLTNNFWFLCYKTFNYNWQEQCFIKYNFRTSESKAGELGVQDHP